MPSSDRRAATTVLGYLAVQIRGEKQTVKTYPNPGLCRGNTHPEARETFAAGIAEMKQHSLSQGSCHLLISKNNGGTSGKAETLHPVLKLGDFGSSCIKQLRGPMRRESRISLLAMIQHAQVQCRNAHFNTFFFSSKLHNIILS